VLTTDGSGVGRGTSIKHGFGYGYTHGGIDDPKASNIEYGCGCGDEFGDGCGDSYGCITECPCVTALIIDSDPVTTAYQALTMQALGEYNGQA